MDGHRQMPVSLKVVAALFILSGIFAAINVLVSLAIGNINFDVGVLGLFIGPGLLALRPGWRTCALVFLWIGMIGLPIIAVLMLAHSGPLDFKMFGVKAGYASRDLGLLFAVIVFAVDVWQYRVLVRHDVRKRFGLEGA